VPDGVAFQALVLFIVIFAVCFGLAFFGLTMCRLAARSDASDALALATWIAMSPPSRLPSEPAVTAAADAEPLEEDRPETSYRQAG
jgi:hypothetical protein